jgi:hypothetical protein
LGQLIEPGAALPEGADILKRFVQRMLYDHFGIEVIGVPKDKKNLIKIRTDPRYVDVLREPEFQRSVESVKSYTSLDTARLANLWQLSRLSNPQGNMLEAGVYRGGGSLHLHNAAPDRKIFLCDTFEGFAGMEMDRVLDERFRPDFKPNPKAKRPACTDTSAEMVHDLMSASTQNFQIIAGIFPGSDVNKDVNRACAEAALEPSIGLGLRRCWLAGQQKSPP